MVFINPVFLPPTPYTFLSEPYPKANANPIIAPIGVLKYGLHMRLQVLPIFEESRLIP
jgi:hypothetical protein